MITGSIEGIRVLFPKNLKPYGIALSLPEGSSFTSADAQDGGFRFKRLFSDRSMLLRSKTIESFVDK